MTKVKDEISYKALKNYLKDLGKKQLSGGFAPVYLIYGDLCIKPYAKKV